MAKLDIISIGGATVDIFTRPQKSNIIRWNNSQGEQKDLLCFEYGAKLKMADVHETFGGGAANTAIGFHRLGLKSGVSTLVGEDEWGQKVINNFQKEGVDTSFIEKTSADKSSFSIVINSFEGDRTLLFYPGANKKLRPAHLKNIAFNSSKWLFLNRVSSDDSKIIAHLSKQIHQNPKLKIAWNPGGSQIKEGMRKYAKLLQRVELLFLNKEEAAEFSGLKFKKSVYEQKGYLATEKNCRQENTLPSYAYNVKNIFKKLHRAGVKNVIITDGQRGAQAFDGKNIFFCPIDKQKRVDTLGAGDAFGTGFTYAYLQKLSLQICLKFGTINATSVVNFYGAQAGLLSKRQLQEQFEKTNLKTKKLI